MKFGKIIKEARKASNLTQTELGNMIGRTQGQISEWEKDKTEPSSEDKVKLCTALNISLYKMYGTEDEYDVAVEAARQKGLSPEEAVKAVEMFALYKNK